jgi:hypothetical protein
MADDEIQPVDNKKGKALAAIGFTVASLGLAGFLLWYFVLRPYVGTSDLHLTQPILILSQVTELT